ncbi:hypothetical protein [Sphingobium chungbukense]|uniref:Uncharacterized protein n=1 Tax=Sphingobium chungbukense TaxID=56193 RepID=A0A0M3APS2_9SPHN|nr:hypothetical protein [Sphingobium chungbukense]KKW92187.1 hypothetical protein YP76_09580 [Sphingobium chungbukense]
MAEDRRNESSTPFDNLNESTRPTGRSRGSLVIFILVALALILAVGFFYATKGNHDRGADALIDAADAPDSAARVVGNAAKNAADRLQNHE